MALDLRGGLQFLFHTLVRDQGLKIMEEKHQDKTENHHHHGNKKRKNPSAEECLNNAEELKTEMLRAFMETQANSPVVPLRNGTWVPYYPASVHTPGPIGDYFPKQDVGRSWCYDIELGTHHMVPLGVLEPDATEVDRMIDHMEDVYFLSEGMGGYPAAEAEADWFNKGGFAKVQPYYARNAEIYAMRDDVKPFLRLISTCWRRCSIWKTCPFTNTSSMDATTRPMRPDTSCINRGRCS